MKTCFTCGEKMTPRDTYIEHDEYVGIITIPNVKYFVCRRCGEESVSGEILQKIDEEYKRLLSELLWKRLGSIDAINHQYMTNRELVEKLGISRQAIAKNFLIKGRIFNIVLFGQQYYLRESVELFLRTGDGRFPLVNRVNDNSNKYADSNASSFSRQSVIPSLPPSSQVSQVKAASDKMEHEYV